MPQRSLASKVSPSARFMTSPVVLKTLPRVMSPTGTVIGPPVSCTGIPRTRPSVGCREMARTMLSPMCCATSRFRWRLTPSTSTSVVSRLYCSGMPSTGNSTSTTGPMMREMRPTPPTAWVSLRSLTDAVMVSLSLALGQRAGAADDFADLLGDLRLARLVGQSGVLLDELLGVVRGRLHRPLAGGELGRGGLEHAVEEPGVDVLRQQRVEHLLGAGLEGVQRQEVIVIRRLLPLDDLERQQADDLGLLGDHRDEPAEDDVHLVDAALLGRRREVVDQPLAHLAGRLERGLLGVAAPLRRTVAVAELVEADRLAAEQVGNDLLALLAQGRGEALALLDDRRAVGTGETAVGRDDHDRGALDVLLLGGQRVLLVGERRHGRDRAGQGPGVRARLAHRLLRLDDAGRGHELHRPGDLLGRADGTDAVPVLPDLRSHTFPPS